MTKWKRAESGVYEAYIGEWYMQAYTWAGFWHGSASTKVGEVRHIYHIAPYATAKEAKHAIVEAVRKLSAQDGEGEE